MVSSWLNLLIAFAFSTPTGVLIVKPGENRSLTTPELRRFANQEITIQCKQELKCKIGFEYVGKKYSLKMPNGNNYAYYKKKEQALAAGGLLISSKVCDRLELDMDNDEVVN